jgi:hypothetical protein
MAYGARPTPYLAGPFDCPEEALGAQLADAKQNCACAGYNLAADEGDGVVLEQIRRNLEGSLHLAALSSGL